MRLHKKTQVFLTMKIYCQVFRYVKDMNTREYRHAKITNILFTFIYLEGLVK